MTVSDTEDQLQPVNAWIGAMQIEDKYRVQRSTSPPRQIIRCPLAAVMKSKRRRHGSPSLSARVLELKKPSVDQDTMPMLQIILPRLFGPTAVPQFDLSKQT